jgi:hypothetical protein
MDIDTTIPEWMMTGLIWYVRIGVIIFIVETLWQATLKAVMTVIIYRPLQAILSFVMTVIMWPFVVIKWIMGGDES